jgi:hypothetical protein
MRGLSRLAHKNYIMNNCTKCNSELKTNAKFCNKCGTKVVSQVQIVEKPSNSDSIGLKMGYLNWVLSPSEVCNRIYFTEVRRLELAKGIVVGPGTKAVLFTISDEGVVFELDANTYEFPTSINKEEQGKQIQATERKLRDRFNELDKINPEQLTVWNKISLFFTSKKNKNVAKNEIREGKKALAEAVEKKIKDLNTDISNLKRNVTEVFMIYLFQSGNIKLVFPFENIPTKSIVTSISLELSIKIVDYVGFVSENLVDSYNGMSVSKLEEMLHTTFEFALANILSKYNAEEINYNQTLANEIIQEFNKKLNENGSSCQVSSVSDLKVGDETLTFLRKKQDETYLLEQNLSQEKARNKIANLYATTNNDQEVEKDLIELNKESNFWSNEKNRLLLEDEKKRYNVLLEKEEILFNAKNEEELNTAKADIIKTGLLRDQDVELLLRKVKEESQDHDTLRNHSRNLLLLNQNFEIADLESDSDLKRKRAQLEAELGYTELHLDIESKKSDAKRNDRVEDLKVDDVEMNQQLDLAERASKLTEAKRKSTHERALEEAGQKNQHELDKIQMYKGMSVEEIMVLNPDLSEFAAKAITEKFKAQAEVSSMDTRAADAEKNLNMMKEFMEKQQQSMVDVVKSVTSSNSGSDNSDSSNNPNNAAPPNHVFCGECGKTNPKNMKFCGDCGSGL